MSTHDAPADDTDKSTDPGSLTDPDEYGSLSVEDDADGTVDPGDLAGGANETDEDVS